MVTKTYNYQVALFITVVLFLVFTFLPYLADDAALATLFGENGVFAALTAGYLFVTAVVFFVSFLRFRNRSWLLRLSYLALAILLFYVAGKSINWGGHLIPSNVSQYVNQLSPRTGFGIPVSGTPGAGQFIVSSDYNDLLVVFVVAFVLAIPVVSKFFPKAGKFVDSVFPVMPLGPSVLVLAAYLIEKGSANLLAFLPSPNQLPTFSGVQVDEISNHAYAFALVVATIFYFMIKSDQKKKEDDEALLRELTYFRR